MREILFRGKGTSGHHINKWTYGYYCKDFWKPRKGHGIFPTNPEEGGYVEIFHETLGQYTGLKDKNGKKIFEGDIVKVKHGYAGNPNYPTAEYIEVVEYDARSCCYEFYRWSGDIYGVEVIGNIHDNQELLKGENTNG